MKHKFNKGKKKKSRSNSGSGIRGGRGPLSSAQIYTGPVRLPGRTAQLDTIVTQLTETNALISSATGVINQVFPLNISLFTGYTNFTNAWDEFRLLAAEFEFIPSTENAVVSTFLYAPVAFVIDRDSATVLTSLSSALEYSSCKVQSLTKRLKLQFKMNGSEDAGFVTTSTVSTAWFKTYGAALTANTQYGEWIIRALWQFRGRA
jgi:hypothetical protein